MRPSFMSALGAVIGTCVAAAAIGLLVGLGVEWGVISGAVGSGQFIDLVLVGVVAFVLVVGALVARARRRRRPTV